jgi:hypothetical protein
MKNLVKNQELDEDQVSANESAYIEGGGCGSNSCYSQSCPHLLADEDSTDNVIF